MVKGGKPLEIHLKRKTVFIKLFYTGMPVAYLNKQLKFKFVQIVNFLLMKVLFEE